MSSVTVPVGNPPILASASRRTTNEVPMQNAVPQASLAGCITSKKARCSSTQHSVERRLYWIGSAL
ncbi:hypothetical protein D3C87_1256290 [compost metagenome]